MVVSLEVLRDWIGGEGVPSTSLIALQEGAIAFLQDQTGRYLGEPTTITEIRRGTGRPYVFVSNEPGDGAITVESLYDGGTDWIAVEARDFELEGRRLYHRSWGWSKGSRFRIAYPAGYTVETAPPSLRLAVLDLCAHLYRSRVVTTPAMDGGVLPQSTSLPMTVRRWIESHRIPVGLGVGN